MLGDKSSDFHALTQDVFPTFDDMFVDKYLFSPFINRRVNLQGLAIGCGPEKTGIDLQERVPNNSARLFQLSKGREPAFHEKIVR